MLGRLESSEQFKAENKSNPDISKYTQIENLRNCENYFNLS